MAAVQPSLQYKSDSVGNTTDLTTIIHALTMLGGVGSRSAGTSVVSFHHPYSLCFCAFMKSHKGLIYVWKICWGFAYSCGHVSVLILLHFSHTEVKSHTIMSQQNEFGHYQKVVNVDNSVYCETVNMIASSILDARILWLCWTLHKSTLQIEFDSLANWMIALKLI